MRALFHWIMEDRGRALVHAAAVGRSDGGLLIVGRGGSGKSTTALVVRGPGPALPGGRLLHRRAGRSRAPRPQPLQLGQAPPPAGEPPPAPGPLGHERRAARTPARQRRGEGAAVRGRPRGRRRAHRDLPHPGRRRAHHHRPAHHHRRCRPRPGPPWGALAPSSVLQAPGGGAGDAGPAGRGWCDRSRASSCDWAPTSTPWPATWPGSSTTWPRIGTREPAAGQRGDPPVRRIGVRRRRPGQHRRAGPPGHRGGAWSTTVRPTTARRWPGREPTSWVCR